MPIYEVVVSAKMYIRMEGNTPEEAENNVQALLEDYYMQIPCGGHTLDFGKYKAKVWANDTKPEVKREVESLEEKGPGKWWLEEDE